MLQSTSRISPEETEARQAGVVDLIRELRDEALTRVRKDVELARVEMSEKVSRTARNSSYLGIGARRSQQHDQSLRERAIHD